MSGPEDRSLRELMTSSQTDEQRRQIYLTLTQPILAAVTDHLQAYFQHLYRVAPPRQPGEEQVPESFCFRCPQNPEVPCRLALFGALLGRSSPPLPAPLVWRE